MPIRNRIEVKPYGISAKTQIVTELYFLMSNASGNRKYSQDEIRALIQRASQMREERHGNSDQQLSLAEVEHIASELDIPADLVRSAALEMDNTPTTRKSNIFGGPFHVNRSRVFDKPLTDEQWNEMVAEIRSRTGRRGTVEETARLKEWHHFIGEGDQGVNFAKTNITVRSSEDESAVKMERRFAGLAIPSYAMTLFFATLFSVFIIEGFDGMGLSTATNFAIFFGFLFTSLGLVRASLSASARRHENNFDFLMSRFAEILDVEPETQVLPDTSEISSSEADNRPMIDLEDSIDDYHSAEASQTRNRDKS
ncbi:MAG: hypothetical protein HKN43_16530 [Rhodothermales bacterium]|nr:hypothetical protein [Rhodothermales bacterium]